jgi:hypothetical protein
MKRRRRRPYAAPCHDPLDLWFVEFERDGKVLRSYHADGPEARAALAVERARLTTAQQRMIDVIKAKADADGWADWDHVYPEWEPTNVPVQFGGRAAQLVWAALERRGLVEQRRPDMKVRVKP